MGLLGYLLEETLTGAPGRVCPGPQVLPCSLATRGGPSGRLAALLGARSLPLLAAWPGSLGGPAEQQLRASRTWPHPALLDTREVMLRGPVGEAS